MIFFLQIKVFTHFNWFPKVTQNSIILHALKRQQDLTLKISSLASTWVYNAVKNGLDFNYISTFLRFGCRMALCSLPTVNVFLEDFSVHEFCACRAKNL